MPPHPVPTGPSPPPSSSQAAALPRLRPLRLAVAWTLVAGGAALLALPWALQLSKKHQPWVHEGLTGIALAAVGFLVLLSAIRPATLQALRGMRREAGSILLTAGFGIAIVYAINVPGLVGIGVMGLIVLVTTLVAGNLMSDEDRITAEEMRNAITLAIVTVFLGLVAFGKDDTLADGSILGKTFDNLWKILLTVIGFHFTTTAAEGAVKALAERPAKPSGEQQTKA